MTAGQVSDYTGAAALLDDLPKAQWLLGDRGYDADWFRDALQAKGIQPCIPGRRSRNEPVRYDRRRYALSLYALNRGPRWEAGAALAKGGIILVFGLAVIVEIADKIANGVPPSSTLMLTFGGVALAANLTCLALLWRFRTENVNMSSTFECSRNDVASNVGVLVAAGLVAGTGSAWPDIAVGAIIAVIFLHSAWRVLREAVPAWREARPMPAEVLR